MPQYGTETISICTRFSKKFHILFWLHNSGDGASIIWVISESVSTIRGPIVLWSNRPNIQQYLTWIQFYNASMVWISSQTAKNPLRTDEANNRPWRRLMDHGCFVLLYWINHQPVNFESLLQIQLTIEVLRLVLSFIKTYQFHWCHLRQWKRACWRELLQFGWEISAR